MTVTSIGSPKLKLGILLRKRTDMNNDLREEIQQFLKTFDIHGPELAKCDWAGNPDFHLLKQARKLLIRAVSEPDLN